MSWVLLAALLAALAVAAYKGVPSYDAFVEGAADGLSSALRIAPYLVAVMVAVALMRASGLMDALESVFAPVMAVFGLPRSLTALFLIRPLSGAAALSEVSAVYASFGPDSFEGMAASIMMGSTETVFYTIGIYMGAAGYKKTRYAVPISLATCVAGAAAAGILARFY